MDDDFLPAADADATRGRPVWGSYVLALLVLAATLLVVFVYWQGARDRQLEAAQADFVARSEQMRVRLEQRLDSYELVTRGGVSLVASVARPSRRQWQNYVDGLSLRARFPALVGLGFSVYATPGQLGQMQQMLKDSGEGLFSVRPHGLREHYGAILYLEPKSAENVSALGYDMYSEPVRHAAMQAALEQGEARISGRVQLVQDGGATTPSLLLYQPVYRAGDHPRSVAARRESMQGWVYIAFRVAPFVETALTRSPRHWLRITDISGSRPELLYEDRAPEGGRPPAFVHTSDLDVFGRRWRVEFRSQPIQAMQAQMAGLRTTLAIGILASLLMFLVVLVLVRTRQRAEMLARRMTESYRRSEMRFRSAMQHSAVGMALLDTRGQIVETNPALEAILGRDRRRLLGTTLAGHLDSIQDAPAQDAPASARDDRAGDGARHQSATLRRGDGDRRQLQITRAPMQGDVGQDIVSLVEVEDVTDRLRAQAEVLALNRSLEARVQARTRELSQANDELESFAYSVSHDLRAPLRAIDGFSRLLAERQGERIDEDGREHLARVRNATARMAELIDAMLKMARLGRGELRPEPLDLSAMARDVAAELQASEPGRRVDVTIAPGLRAIGDHALVYNLVQNLLGNAWKFTRGREQARIEVGRNDAGEFFVGDNGAGFDPGYANKLFRPFQRLHSEVQFAGHGIGLASVKRIVERHGGAIRAEGRPGNGATFYFSLPEPA